MRLKPLEQWICDECNEVIAKVGDGYVEWLHPLDGKAHGFRIIHHAPHSPRRQDDPPSERSRGGNCYRYTNAPGRMDISLDSYAGANGLPTLLRLVDIGPYHDENYSGPMARDLREWTELFRRLQLPYYEEARLYWQRALEDGYFDGANEVWIYLPDTLKRLIDRYAEAD